MNTETVAKEVALELGPRRLGMNTETVAKDVALELGLDEHHQALPETILLIMEVVRMIIDMIGECPQNDDRRFGERALELAVEMETPGNAFRDRVRWWMLTRRIRNRRNGLGQELYRDLGGAKLPRSIIKVATTMSAKELEELHCENCECC